jgi:hypothetical protein
VRSAVCGRCGGEVRYGTRGTTTGWLHRVDGDHQAILGRPLTADDLAEIERQQHVVRYYDDGKPYTTAEHDILRDKDTARRKVRLAALHGVDPDYVEPLPEPEVRRTDVEVDELPPRSGMRQIANLLMNSPDWGLRRLTRARGPYVGADGSVLSISDSLVIGGRGPEVDGGVAVAVGSWRDGKFDSAYAGILRGRRFEVHPVNATELKSWIKENHAPNPSQGDDRQGLGES